MRSTLAEKSYQLFCRTKPAPYLRWLGGKRSIASEIVRLMPAKFGHYWEPFCGAAGIYMNMQFLLSRAPFPATLSDLDPLLIAAHRAVRDHPDAVTRAYAIRQRQNSKSYFLAVRSDRPDDPIEAAALYIYLNHSCWSCLLYTSDAADE